MNSLSGPKENDIIKSLLWDLMLSTNDCYPGCGCEWDFFDMTLDRVKSWILKNDFSLALDQIDQLIFTLDIDIGDYLDQPSLEFSLPEEQLTLLN